MSPHESSWIHPSKYLPIPTQILNKLMEFNHSWWKKSQTTTWDIFNEFVNHGINYQPQLVQDFWTINSITSIFPEKNGKKKIQRCQKRPSSPQSWCNDIYYMYVSGQIIIFHQPGFSWNKGISLTKPPFDQIICMSVLLPTKSWKSWFVVIEPRLKSAILLTTVPWYRGFCWYGNPRRRRESL